jgi:hypothetical protein
VHSEHLRAMLVISEKRSGNINTHSSHTSHAIIDIITKDKEKNPPINISGENIIR